MGQDVILQLLLLFGLMLLFLFLRFPVFLSLVLASVGYMLAFPGKVPLPVIGQSIISGINNVNFTAIVFYFLLGEIMNSGGLSDRLVSFCKACIGHVRGSLSHINIIASIVFAGVSGSAMADTASIGAMMIPTMKRDGYPAGYAAAITQCSSIIGPIIPPSTGLVLMGIYLNASVRKLFLGGMIPGVLMGGFLLVVSYIISKKRNFPHTPWGGWRNVWEKRKEGVGAFLLPVIIMICLVCGIGTIVEIGALSCVFAVALSYAYKEMSLKKLGQILMNTTVIIGKVLCVLASAGTFVWIIGSMGVADWIANRAMTLGVGSTGVMAFCVIALFFLGMILDVGVIQMVILPVMAPVILAVGIDPTQFGVLAILVSQLGLCTPPVGALIYMTAGIAECSSVEVVKESVPFIAALLVLIGLLVLFPQITLLIPNLLT